MREPTDRSAPPVPLTAGEVVAAAGVLARALVDDPGWLHVFPDDATRLARLTVLLERVVDRAYVHLGASRHLPGRAVAVWAPPGAHDLPAATMLRLAPRAMWLVGRRLPAALRMFRAMSAGTPREPHHYLAILGVDPAHQGQGLGVALLAPTLAVCDDTRTLAWLESTNPRNHGFYRRLGFELAQATPIPGGPTISFFARQPR